MIVRTLVTLFAIFSIYLGISNLQKLNTMRVSDSDFEQFDGTIVTMVHDVDDNPGYAVTGGFNKQLIQINFAYTVNGIEHTANSISPICSRCEAHHVLRMTGLKPTELTPGTPLKVYVSKADDNKAYLALPTSGEKQSQMLSVFLWLVFVPALMLLFFKLEGSGRKPDETVVK